jgi:hypothetical protein
VGPHTHCDREAVDWFQQGQILLSILLQIKSKPVSKINSKRLTKCVYTMNIKKMTSTPFLHRSKG